MNITIWDILRYIIKWKFAIAAMTILSLIIMNNYVNNNQSYTAMTIIKYNSEEAQKGMTADDKKLDVYELTAPHVIAAAIKDLNVKLSAESVRSHISITPIIPNEQEKIKDAKIKATESYSYFPIYYQVSYTVGSPRDGTNARDVLDAVIKNYNIYYSEAHINQSILPEIISSEDVGTYDYLEIAELMNTKTQDTISFLKDKSDAAPDFRSSITGMSFDDLSGQYNIIRDFTLPTLMSDIFNSQITKNREVLLKNYAYKKNQFLLECKNEQEKTDLTLSLMKEFVRNNYKILAAHKENNSQDQDVGRTDVVDNEEYNRIKTTYDQLVDQYVEHRSASGEAKINADYCDKVTAHFTQQPQAAADNAKLVKKVQQSIPEINNRLTDLYKLTDQTIRDYNQYTASQTITSLTGIGIRINLSKRFYMFIAFVLGLALSIIMAIAIEIIRKFKKTGSGQDENEHTFAGVSGS